MDRSPPDQHAQGVPAARHQTDVALTEGVPCPFCNYDLRGSPPGGQCPECGTAIPPNRMVTLARFGGEAWLRRAERGVGRSWRAVVAMFLLVPVLVCWGVPTDDNGYAPPSTAWYVVLGLLLGGVWLALGFAAYGLWAFSTRHPVIDRVEPAISARRAVRMAICWAFVAIAISKVWSRWFPLSAWDSVWRNIVILSIPVSGAMILLALGWRVAHLGTLAGDKQTAACARRMMTVFILACVLEVPAVPVARFEPVIGAAVVLLGLMIVGSGLVLLLSPAFLVRHLRAALAELAGKTDGAASAPISDDLDGGLTPSSRRT